MTLLLLLLGLVFLVIGAEFLVRGASQLAILFKISPLVIGLTVVAFGTSAPELAVTLKAISTDLPDVAVGNNVGSTIFNILFILGLCALISPLKVKKQLIWLDIPLMIFANLIFYTMSLKGYISRYNSIFLLACLIGYTIFNIRKSRKESNNNRLNENNNKDQSNQKKDIFTISKNIGYVIIGLLFCVVGAGLMVDSSVVLARLLGVSELVISLTILAGGTSLPELATSFVATIRGEKDIAIGNIVGSNIFNILAIMGLAGLVAPEGLVISESALDFDLPVSLACCIACLPIFFTGHTISRSEGALFLGYYIAYICYLFLNSKDHSTLPYFNQMMLWFVIPLTVLTGVIILYRYLKNEHA